MKMNFYDSKYEELHNFFKKEGVWLILNILYRNNNDWENPKFIGMNDFYSKIKFCGGYYNLFYRVKEKLLKYRIIQINEESKLIGLTPKGIKLLSILDYLHKEIFKNGRY